MKSFILPTTLLLALFLPSCASSKVETATIQPPTPQATKTLATPPPSEEQVKGDSKIQVGQITITDENGNVIKGVAPDLNTQVVKKSPKELYDFLITKGWQVKDFRQGDFVVFDTSDTGGFTQDKIGFFVLKYDNVDKAISLFNNIDNVYRKRFGRAVMARNFIIGIAGGRKRINDPTIIELTEIDYIKLQTDLNEFCQKP